MCDKVLLFIYSKYIELELDCRNIERCEIRHSNYSRGIYCISWYYTCYFISTFLEISNYIFC